MLRNPFTTSARDEPEPFAWRQRLTLRERLLAAVGAPVIVGVVLFAGAVATAVLLAVAQPHDPVIPADSGAEGEALLGQAEDASPGIDEMLATGIPSDAGTVVVHITGNVARPGVLELPVGSRVADAIAAAGGATDEAAAGELNLARVLIDGERIAVVRGDEGATIPASTRSTVSLNSATAEQFETLPRIGPQIAERIVEWRQAHGGFRSVDQLLQISGIGTKTLEGFRDRVTL